MDPRYQRQPSDLSRIFVPGRDGVQVPLDSVISVSQGLAPLVVNHQGPFPAVTINYGLTAGMTLQDAQMAMRQAIAELHMPDEIRAESARRCRGCLSAAGKRAGRSDFWRPAGRLHRARPFSTRALAHPITIILDAALSRPGRACARRLTDIELTVIAFIGIILLIGIVKKNGIMRWTCARGGARARPQPRASH